MSNWQGDHYRRAHWEQPHGYAGEASYTPMHYRSQHSGRGGRAPYFDNSPAERPRSGRGWGNQHSSRGAGGSERGSWNQSGRGRGGGRGQGGHGDSEPQRVAGMVFGCNRNTEEECMRGLFGLPASQWEQVAAVRPGTPLFLFNMATRVMHGTWRATTGGGWNLDPLAWGGDWSTGSPFPAQVRAERVGRPTSVHESAFKTVLEANYYTANKFKLQLTPSQVGGLKQLLREAAGSSAASAAPKRGADAPARQEPEKRQRTGTAASAPAGAAADGTQHAPKFVNIGLKQKESPSPAKAFAALTFPAPLSRSALASLKTASKSATSEPSSKKQPEAEAAKPMEISSMEPPVVVAEMMEASADEQRPSEEMVDPQSSKQPSPEPSREGEAASTTPPNEPMDVATAEVGAAPDEGPPTSTAAGGAEGEEKRGRGPAAASANVQAQDEGAALGPQSKAAEPVKEASELEVEDEISAKVAGTDAAGLPADIELPRTDENAAADEPPVVVMESHDSPSHISKHATFGAENPNNAATASKLDEEPNGEVAADGVAPALDTCDQSPNGLPSPAKGSDSSKDEGGAAPSEAGTLSVVEEQIDVELNVGYASIGSVSREPLSPATGLLEEAVTEATNAGPLVADQVNAKGSQPDLGTATAIEQVLRDKSTDPPEAATASIAEDIGMADADASTAGVCLDAQVRRVAEGEVEKVGSDPGGFGDDFIPLTSP